MRLKVDVLVAADAAEASRIASPPSSIRAAVIDVLLPGRSSALLVDDLRRGGLSGPVIGMSGYPVGAAFERGDLAGLAGYFLPKPFTPAQLLAVVETALREYAARS